MLRLHFVAAAIVAPILIVAGAVWMLLNPTAIAFTLDQPNTLD
jgi:hypothetical protein